MQQCVFVIACCFLQFIVRDARTQRSASRRACLFESMSGAAIIRLVLGDTLRERQFTMLVLPKRPEGLW
jgi:hypothetical protein